MYTVNAYIENSLTKDGDRSVWGDVGTLITHPSSFLLPDVDECMNKTACQTNAICINTIGRHHCISLEFGVTHNGKYLTHVYI